MIPEIKLRPNCDRRLQDGGVWVFRNELDMQGKDHPAGTWARLVSANGRPLAVGFLNTRGQLAYRVVARSGEFAAEEDPKPLLEARVRAAVALRDELGMPAAGRRLVFSEGDRLPGLVVDQYGEALTLQIGAAGLERHRDWLLGLLADATGCKAVVERSEGPAREREGLETRAGVAWRAEGFDEATLADWTLKESGCVYHADLLAGAKTGYFLDQRETRAWAARLAGGRACLDVFCNTGGFSVAMAKAGAASVLGLDASEGALELAARNARSNRVGKLCVFEQCDAFERLRAMERQDARFGLVVLDPPAMAKAKEGIEGALRGYKELNLRALRLLQPGGYLITCSCTQAVDDERFMRQLVTAAHDARTSLKQLALLHQPPDHPWVPGMPETRYLKAAVVKKA